MQKYYEISNKKAVAAIQATLEPLNKFNKKLDQIIEKYQPDDLHVWFSLDRGKIFSHLWFTDKNKIDTTLFKVTYSVKNHDGEYGHEARPRKVNKKFYKEFMEDLEGVNFKEFTKVLFGKTQLYGLNISYKENGEKFYLSVNEDIVLPHKEITASKYIAIKDQDIN